MNQRRRILRIGLACLILLVIVPWVLPPLHHPLVYKGQPLSYWLPRLNRYPDPTPQEALDKFGVAAVPMLINALDARDTVWKKSYRAAWRFLPQRLKMRVPEPVLPEFVRSSALRGIEHLGPKAKAAVPDLIRFIEDVDRSKPPTAVRVHERSGSYTVLFENKFDLASAARALGQIGPEAKLAVPVLKTLLHDRESSVRVTAATALWRIEGDSQTPVVLPVVTEVLKGSDANDRSVALSALKEMAPAAKSAVPLIVETMRNADSTRRRECLECLMKIDALDQGVVPVLIDALGDPNEWTRSTAIDVLKRLGRDAKAAVPALLSAKNDLDPSVRQRVPGALAEIAPEAKEVLMTVVGLLTNQMAGVAGNAAIALESLGMQAVDAIPALVSVVSGQDSRDVFAVPSAIQSLGMLGSAAVEAVPALVRTLQTTNDRWRVSAAIALGRIGVHATSAVPALVHAAANGDILFRLRSAEALAAIDPTIKDAMPMLRGFLDHTNHWYRLCASKTLWSLNGKRNDEALFKAAARVLETGDRFVELEGAAVVVEMQPGDTAGLTVLLRSLESSDGNLNHRASRFLAGLGAKAKEAAPALIRALSHRDHRVRADAARALGEIGSAQALPRLRETLKDEVLHVRLEAARAVEKIGPGAGARAREEGNVAPPTK